MDSNSRVNVCLLVHFIDEIIFEDFFFWEWDAALSENNKKQ